MALSGNWDEITYTPDTSVSESVSTTYPADLPESDPNYSLRGTTVESIAHPNTKTTTTHSNVYIIIRSIVVDANDVGVGPDTFNKLIKYETCYRVYESEATRRADIEDYTHEKHINDIVYDPSQDLFDQAYTQLKALEGFDNLVDA